MPCYPCNHCNKCGIFSLRLELACKTCGADVIPGADACPDCHTPYRGNTLRGKIGKPKGTVDYYTRIEEAQGLDEFSRIDLAEQPARSDPASQSLQKA